MPHALFRADASLYVGSGHIMRCLTLAQSLRSKGWQVSFVTRLFPGNLIDHIKTEGFTVHALPALPQQPSPTHPTESDLPSWLGTDWQADARQTAAVLQQLPVKKVDWLIVDHYGIEAKWETFLRPYTRRILVMDDLANRPHSCEMLLDPNVLTAPRQSMTPYTGKIPAKTRQLLGPRYALLRPEFARLRDKRRVSQVDPQHMLVFFGGSDPSNQTKKALEALLLLEDPQLTADVVIGKNHPDPAGIRQLCERTPHFSLHVQTSRMAELLLRAGVVIGAGGTHTWERCCLGVPSVMVAVAANQVPLARAVHENGMALYLGRAEETTVEQMAEAVRGLRQNAARLSRMAACCLRTVDGKGAERVVAAMEETGGD